MEWHSRVDVVQVHRLEFIECLRCGFWLVVIQDGRDRFLAGLRGIGFGSVEELSLLLVNERHPICV